MTTCCACAHPDVFIAPAMDASSPAPPGAVLASAAQLPSPGPQLAVEHADLPDLTLAVRAHTTVQMKQVRSLTFPGHMWLASFSEPTVSALLSRLCAR